MAAVDTYRKLGAAKVAAGDVSGALKPLRLARRLAPDDPKIAQVLSQALFVLGEQDRLTGRLADAKDKFTEAAEHSPDDPVLWNGLAQCCAATGAVDDAVAHYQMSLEQDPDKPAVVLSNMANALVRLNRYDEATEAYLQALALGPTDPEIQHNWAFHLLRLGKLAEGWDSYQSRLDRSGQRPPLDGPTWDGSNPAGQTVAVWSEQGIGDELMFGTCIPDLVKCAGHVVWECAPKLVGLLARSFPGVSVVARPPHAEVAKNADQRFPWRSQVPRIDSWTGIASLPRFFRRNIGAFNQSGGYGVAAPVRRQMAANWLADIPRPRVGVCWRSGVVNVTRNLVYAAPADIAPVLRAMDIAPVLLQYRVDRAEIAELAAAGVSLSEMPELDLFDDFEGLAGLIAELDLVISAGTVVAELAGALGVPVWRFGPHSDYTMLGETRRPWFNSMRSFSKPDADRDWAPVFRAMESELRVYSGLAA